MYRNFFDRILSRVGLVRMSYIRDQLNFARSVGKRLDEHREVVETIAQDTSLFETAEWHLGHMEIQDDYLMRLYFLVHGTWPTDLPLGEYRQITEESVRRRPGVFGPCRLPEYSGQR